MDLRHFIRTTITEIVTGVADARKTVEPFGAKVGSDEVHGHTREAKIITDENGRVITNVEFDIALTKADATDTKGGVGVFFGAVGLGGQTGVKDEDTASTRVKFSVPVVLPGTIAEEKAPERVDYMSEWGPSIT